ncbi:MAG: hypothetical protein ACLRPW_07345 [Intestinibacter sp.]
MLLDALLRAYNIHVHLETQVLYKEDIFSGAKAAARVDLQLLYVWQIQAGRIMKRL